jgi:Ulp1 family protease
MVVVCNPGSSISVDTSNKDTEIPAFVCMDSLNWHPVLNYHPMKKICTVLRKYMEVEWKCEQKDTIPIRLTARNFPDVHPKIPLQKNGYDYGVFILKYAAWFFEEHIKGNQIRITQESVANQLNIDINEDIFRYSVGKALIKCTNS